MTSGAFALLPTRNDEPASRRRPTAAALQLSLTGCDLAMSDYDRDGEQPSLFGTTEPTER